MADRVIMQGGDPSGRIDIGSGCYLLPLWYDYEEKPPLRIVGWVLYHPKPDGTECGGSVMLAGEPFADEGTREAPITLSPSIRCHCGFHGWVRGGKWGS